MDNKVSLHPLSDIVMAQFLKEGIKITYITMTPMAAEDFLGLPSTHPIDYSWMDHPMYPDIFAYFMNDQSYLSTPITKIYQGECPCGLRECEYHLVK
jgi:hypothetical protein